MSDRSYNVPRKYPDEAWVKGIREGDEQAFEKLFTSYYSALVNFSYTYLQCKHLAEEVVQEVFTDFWEDREHLDPARNIKTYLFQSVKFQSLDILKHKRVITKYHEELMDRRKEQIQPLEHDEAHEIEFRKAVQKAIEILPDKAKTVYILNRKDGLTYNEIAEVMGISNKTVESQMSRALKILRGRLEKFLITMSTVVFSVSMMV